MRLIVVHKAPFTPTPCLPSPAMVFDFFGNWNEHYMGSYKCKDCTHVARYMRLGYTYKGSDDNGHVDFINRWLADFIKDWIAKGYDVVFEDALSIGDLREWINATLATG